MKKLLIIVGAFFGLILAAIIIIPLVVDVDKYRPKIVELANEHIEGRLELGKLKLSLWGQIRIEVAGVDLKDSGGKSVLSVSDAFFHLPLMSVISGSPELIFKMKKPTVHVVKNKAGKLNVMSLVKSAPPAAKGTPPSGAPAPGAPQAQKPSGEPMKLPAIAARTRLGIEFRQALLSYRDEGTALVSEVKDLDFVLKDISLTRPTQLELFAEMDTKMGKTFLLKGPAKMNGKIQPTLLADQFDHVDITLKVDLDGLEMASPGVFEKKKGMAMNADLAMSASAKEANIAHFDFKFFNIELTSSGKVTQISTSPVVEYRMKTAPIQLKPWVELVPMLKQYELGGAGQFSAEAKGPADRIGYQAQFKMDDLTAKAPNLKSQPKFDLAAKVSTDQLESLLITMKAPGNDLKISGKLAGFTAPRGSFQVSSSGMDLDQLIHFPPPKPKAAAADKSAPAQQQASAPVAGGKATPAVDYDAMLEPMRANKMMGSTAIDLNIDMKMLKAYDVKITDILAKLSFRDLAAAIDSFSMKLWKGVIKANFAVQMKPKTPTYRFGTSVEGMDLNEAVSSQMQMFKNTLVGTAFFDLNGDGASFNPDVATTNLKAKGRMRVDKATFATIDVAKMTTEALNKALERLGEKFPQAKGKSVASLPSGSSRYEVVSSDFTIAGGIFNAPGFIAKAESNRGIDIKGDTQVGLKDYSLKTNWEVIDTYNLTHARDISIDQSGVNVPHILAEGSNPIRFPVHAGCTVFAPCYSYTEVPEHLAKVALTNISQAVEGRAKAELKKKADAVIQQASPAVQDKVKDLKKKLFQ